MAKKQLPAALKKFQFKKGGGRVGTSKGTPKK
jgi:hypothetical protein